MREVRQKVVFRERDEVNESVRMKCSRQSKSNVLEELDNRTSRLESTYAVMRMNYVVVKKLVVLEQRQACGAAEKDWKVGKE